MKSHKILITFCVAVSFCIAGFIVWGASVYLKERNNIQAIFVVLEGAKPPDKTATNTDVKKWLGGFSEALPGCLCSLSETAAGNSGKIQLYCVRFLSGGNACNLKPEKLPPGITAGLSSPSIPDNAIKFFFILNHLIPNNGVSPRTDKKIS